MILQCPHCGKQVIVNTFGRPALNSVVTKVCDTLRAYRSVPSAANELDCSRASIYKVLKSNGMTPAGVIEGHATKDNALLNNEGLNNGQ